MVENSSAPDCVVQEEDEIAAFGSGAAAPKSKKRPKTKQGGVQPKVSQFHCPISFIFSYFSHIEEAQHRQAGPAGQGKRQGYPRPG